VQSSGEFSLGDVSSALKKIGKVTSYTKQALDVAQSGIKGLQSAQQFASSLGLGGRPSADGQPSGGFSLGSVSSALEKLNKVTSYSQQAWDFAQSGIQGIQGAQQFASSLGLGGRRAAPASAPAPGGGPDQLAGLMQALLQRQIPSLPRVAPQPVTQRQTAAPTAAQPDALGLLGQIITNPQLQRALQAPSAGGLASTNVQLPVPVAGAPQQRQSLQIPLAAVLSAIGSLAARSESGFAEADDSDVPAYLIGDDGDYLVDPASADDRDALIVHLFRLSDAAQDSGDEPDESEDWARDARW
jgi:hypothetical protein